MNRFVRLCLLALVMMVPVTGSAYAQSAPVISRIIVEGNQRIEKETIYSYMTIAPGDRYNPGKVNKSIKALFATGLFADVSIQRRGDALLVRVVENPVINRIAFEGNKRITDEDLSAEVQLRARVVYTRTRVQNDVQRIIQLYQRSGRFAATVEPKVIQLPQNRVDLVFEIREGPITYIKKINFVGNKRFSDRKLRRAIASTENRWYRFFASSDTYDPDRLAFDRELLRKYYLERGYADMRVVAAVAELTEDRKAFFLTFTVEEGDLYRFGKIDITTTLKDLDIADLMSKVNTVEGEVYNADKVEKSIEALTFEAGRLGYAFVDVRPKVHRDQKSQTIGITYEINEGPRVYVERINITGNVRTMDKVIRREFRLAEGDAFNAAKLRRSRQRIRSLGFFDSVEVSQERGSAPDKTVVTVNVQERSTGELSVGAGFSTSENLIGNLSIRERNLLGKGQDLRASVSLSGRRQQIDLSFTEPYFLERDVSAGFDIVRRDTNYQDESRYDQQETGGTLRAGFPITENLRQAVRYTLQEDTIENVPSDASIFIKSAAGTRLRSSFGYTLTYDVRDDRLEPTMGYIVKFDQDFAGLGGDVRYLKTSIGYGYYVPVADDVVLALTARAGYIFGLGEDVGLNDRFFLGGSGFRGFNSSGIGPRDRSTLDSLGGNLRYVGGAELSFPTGFPAEYGLTGRVFTEAGSLTQVDDNGSNIVDSGSIRLSAGFGLSWRSPFGPLRLDFGFPLIKDDLDVKQIFRFDFGTRF